jgi:hypothetical protein
MIACFSTEALPKLLCLAENKEEINIRQNFANALPLQNGNGWTGLQTIIYKSPEILPTLLN